MDDQISKSTVTDNLLINKIYTIRGHKVMLDNDLAEFYGVETKRLEEQVKRYMELFPDNSLTSSSKQEKPAVFTTGFL